jgi:hypothetical protein
VSSPWSDRVVTSEVYSLLLVLHLVSGLAIGAVWRLGMLHRPHQRALQLAGGCPVGSVWQVCMPRDPQRLSHQLVKV